MNKTVIGGIVGVIVFGAVAIFVINQQDNSTPQTIGNDSQNSITRPAVQATPNTFSIMTPEEKAASEAAARVAAEAVVEAELASSSTEETDG